MSHDGTHSYIISHNDATTPNLMKTQNLENTTCSYRDGKFIIKPTDIRKQEAYTKPITRPLFSPEVM